MTIYADGLLMEPEHQTIQELRAIQSEHQAAIRQEYLKAGAVLLTLVVAAWLAWSGYKFVKGPAVRAWRFVKLWFVAKERQLLEMERRRQENPEPASAAEVELTIRRS
jgi:hypothetical protein